MKKGQKCEVYGLDDYKLVWFDDFDDEQLADYWQVYTGRGRNKEIHKYVDSKENIFLRESNLVLAAKRDADGKYTAGELDTWFGEYGLTYRYGYLEIRAKLPHVYGAFPAFWLGGEIGRIPNSDKKWPVSGEIDIFELKSDGIRGKRASGIQGQVIGAADGKHWFAQGGGQSMYHVLPDRKLYSDDYHNIGLLWTPERLEWYVDGTCTAQKEITAEAYKAYQSRMFILLNFAVHHDYSDPEKIDFDYDEYCIDYIRLYQNSNSDNEFRITEKNK